MTTVLWMDGKRSSFWFTSNRCWRTRPGCWWQGKYAYALQPGVHRGAEYLIFSVAPWFRFELPGVEWGSHPGFRFFKKQKRAMARFAVVKFEVLRNLLRLFFACPVRQSPG